VSAVNDELAKNPGLVNSDPFDTGWMIKVTSSNPGEVDNLLSADDYMTKSGH
jgi:glycine cleavage system H protein